MAVANIRTGIQSALRVAMISVLAELGYKSGVSHVPLEFPGDFKNGDYSSNIALIWARSLKVNPRELADKLVARVGIVAGIEKIEVAGAGFINFYFSKNAYAQAIEEARTEDKWGSSATFDKEQVLIEYTSPNLFKPLHVGNLVGNIIGESI